MSNDVFDKLNKDLPMPLYHQLYNVLKAEIESAKWRPEERLPSEQEIAERFGVSKITVRQALQELAQLGCIRREQGRGTFVTWHKFQKGPRTLTSFTEEMRRHNLVATSRVLAQFIAEADVRVAEALRLPAKSRVLILKRLRLADGEPLVVQIAHIPAALAPGLLLADGISLYEVLLARYHLHPVQAREIYTVALADSSTAQLLEIPVGSPVFRVERVAVTLNERPFEYVQMTVRGDRYSIVLDLVKNTVEQQALTLDR
jgi:GntR family transcriptional regulator